MYSRLQIQTLEDWVGTFSGVCFSRTKNTAGDCSGQLHSTDIVFGG